MKHTFRTYLIALAMAALLLSACGGAPAAASVEQAAVKVDASLIAYTGTIDSMDGDQWVINGEPLMVDPAIIQDGPFQVGDTIKVEGNVNADGSFTVTRVEMPTADDLVQLPQMGQPPVNGNTNDTNANDTNTNDTNTNDDNSNDANTNDDNANDDNSNDDGVDGNSNDANNNDDSYDDNSNSSVVNSNGDDENDDNSNSRYIGNNSNSRNDDGDDGSSGGSGNGGSSNDHGSDDNHDDHDDGNSNGD